MKDVKKICKIAVIQAAPVMFDKDACTQKAVDLIQEASRRGAQLMVFPELFIPGYPYGMTFGFRWAAAAGREGRTGSCIWITPFWFPGKRQKK